MIATTGQIHELLAKCRDAAQQIHAAVTATPGDTRACTGSIAFLDDVGVIVTSSSADLYVPYAEAETTLVKHSPHSTSITILFPNGGGVFLATTPALDDTSEPQVATVQSTKTRGEVEELLLAWRGTGQKLYASIISNSGKNWSATSVIVSVDGQHFVVSDGESEISLPYAEAADALIVRTGSTVTLTLAFQHAGGAFFATVGG